MSSKFTLSSSKESGLLFTLDETLSEIDVEAMLSFGSDEEIEQALHTHAAYQAYWESFALRLKSKLDNFKEEWVAKWWAHNKRFAKDVLASYGETKPTIDSLRDTVINIYSEDTGDTQRNQFSISGYSVANKRASCKSSLEEYTADMLKFLQISPPWYYETIVNTESRFSENYEVVRIVAERLNSKSFHMKEVLSLITPKAGNTGLTDPRNERNLMRSGSR